MTTHTTGEGRILRLWIGVFTLAALTLLLLASSLRFLVRSRGEDRVRDVMWLPHAGLDRLSRP